MYYKSKYLKDEMKHRNLNYYLIITFPYVSMIFLVQGCLTSACSSYPTGSGAPRLGSDPSSTKQGDLGHAADALSCNWEVRRTVPTLQRAVGFKRDDACKVLGAVLYAIAKVAVIFHGDMGAGMS